MLAEVAEAFEWVDVLSKLLPFGLFHKRSVVGIHQLYKNPFKGQTTWTDTYLRI
jgi:hypothetical protein